MIKNNGRFTIRFEKQDQEFVKKFGWEKLNLGYDRAKKFFEYEEDMDIKIYFLYSIEEFEFFRNKKHEKWMVAFAGNNNTIYTFAPSVVEKYTIHTKNHFFFTMIHEIAHFFYRDLVHKKNFSKFSLWNEGIAEYIADRKLDIKIDYYLPTLANFGKKVMNNYKAGFLLISSIMDEFEEGNKKIIQFLTETGDDWKEEELFAKFEEIFKIDANKLIEIKGGIIK